MKHHRAGLIVLAACALFIAACATEPEYPDAPVYGNLLITNQTPNDIQVIRFRVTSPSSDIWGRNMVNEATIVGNAAQLRMPPGTYDFRFESNDIDGFWTFTSVVITAGRDTDLTIQ
jgi:hypothetical protein